MSRLRDGIHRRALLTARFGVARFGAFRFGFCPGQQDLDGLTREIKDQALTGEGPRYVWTERYPNEEPFSGLVTYDATVIAAMEAELTATVSQGYSMAMQMALEADISGTVVEDMAMLMELEDLGYYGQATEQGMLLGKIGPNPLRAPARGVR